MKQAKQNTNKLKNTYYISVNKVSDITNVKLISIEATEEEIAKIKSADDLFQFQPFEEAVASKYNKDREFFEAIPENPMKTIDSSYFHKNLIKKNKNFNDKVITFHFEKIEYLFFQPNIRLQSTKKLGRRVFLGGRIGIVCLMIGLLFSLGPGDLSNGFSSNIHSSSFIFQMIGVPLFLIGAALIIFAGYSFCKYEQAENNQADPKSDNEMNYFSRFMT